MPPGASLCSHKSSRPDSGARCIQIIPGQMNVVHRIYLLHACDACRRVDMTSAFHVLDCSPVLRGPRSWVTMTIRSHGYVERFQIQSYGPRALTTIRAGLLCRASYYKLHVVTSMPVAKPTSMQAAQPWASRAERTYAQSRKHVEENPVIVMVNARRANSADLDIDIGVISSGSNRLRVLLSQRTSTRTDSLGGHLELCLLEQYPVPPSCPQAQRGISSLAICHLAIHKHTGSLMDGRNNISYHIIS